MVKKATGKKGKGEKAMREKAMGKEVISSTVEASTECYLLNVPAEIRLQIYRYLLLPVSLIDVGRIAHSRIRKEKANHPDNDWEYADSEDSENSDDSYSDDVCSACEECHDDELSDPNNPSGSISKSSQCQFAKMHLDILRVNRQIHREASALFYAEAVLALDHSDILCMVRDEVRFPQMESPMLYRFDNAPPANEIWRHNPLKGIGKKNKKGSVKYKSAKMTGALEPHIFAKFQKILFDTYFDDDLDDEANMWIDDETLQFTESHVTEYRHIMERNPCIRAFTQIMSHFRLITHLSVSLDVDVMVASTAIEQAEQTDDESDEDSYIKGGAMSEARKERIEMDEKVKKIENAANEKAAELLVDWDFFEPLAELSNVRHFEFNFSLLHRELEKTTKDYTPPAKIKEKLASLKKRIEGSFKDPDVA